MYVIKNTLFTDVCNFSQIPIWISQRKIKLGGLNEGSKLRFLLCFLVIFCVEIFSLPVLMLAIFVHSQRKLELVLQELMIDNNSMIHYKGMSILFSEIRKTISSITVYDL